MKKKSNLQRKLRKMKRRASRKWKSTNIKWKKTWRRTKKKILAKRNRPKLIAACATVVFLGALWWYSQTKPSYAPYTTYSNSNLNSTTRKQTPRSSTQKTGMKKRHDSVYYNNSAPKAKNSTTQNYSSAYGN
ncbi:hypothetical protein [Candidatus Uabimicrobium amorphum]|nr:hypothetical protein [Candidatus Uabimicrobium amorphum]